MSVCGCAVKMLKGQNVLTKMTEQLQIMKRKHNLQYLLKF